MSANSCIIFGLPSERFLANMAGTGNEININCPPEMCDKISVSILGDKFAVRQHECMILKNTQIMSNSIIGARTVVTGKVGANTVFSGRGCKEGSEVTWSRQRRESFR